MLFDLQGKRRRLIQATYLTLAVLMGGGLVLFGIGSDVQGGLADIFTSSNGSSASPALEDQLEDAEGRLEANPDDPQALADVARLNYNLATATDPEQRAAGAIFGPDAQPRLEAAADAYRRYLEVVPGQPDDALAFSMLQVYGEQGLNQPDLAADAAAVVAQERESTQFYLLLVQYAALAGDERQAELAGERAVDLAPRQQRRQVEQQVETLIQSARAPQPPPGQAPPGGAPLPGGEGLVPPEGGGLAPPGGAPPAGGSGTGGSGGGGSGGGGSGGGGSG